MRNGRFLFLSLALTSVLGISIPATANAEIYLGPGISLYVPSCSEIDAFPESDKGTVLFDLGIIKSERAASYGVSFALAWCFYKERMVGLQTALLATSAKEAYGAQIGLINVVEENFGVQMGMLNSAGKGFGLQAGLLNIYDDESFRLQVGLVNTHRFLFLNGGSVMSGGLGLQAGLLNSSASGAHLQVGAFNFSDTSSVLQVGFCNNMYDRSYGLQVGVINILQGESSGLQIGVVNILKDAGIVAPLIGWHW